MAEAASPDKPASLREAHEAARRLYGEKIEALRGIVQGKFTSNYADFPAAVAAATFATVDLVKSGLDLYVESVASANKSAEENRKSEARNRIAIGWLTAAIMVATAVGAIGTVIGAYRAPDRITIPAPAVTDISICPSR
jgi:hypothetical protein